MSTRIISTPDDIPDGWYVIDDDVVRLEDAEYEKPKRRAPAEDDGAVPLAITAGSHRFAVGDTIEPADGEALDDGFVRSVRRLWDYLLSAAATVVAFVLLEVSGTPWREDLGRQLLVGCAVAIPLNVGVLAAWWHLTRSPDNRITRAMAGRLRDDYDRQRGDAVATVDA